MWGPSSQQNKLEVIEAELQKLVQHGLDGLLVFHTFFCRRVLPKDEVWSRLDRVLQLRDKDSLKGTPGPLHVPKLSNLVCPPLLLP